MTYAARTDAVTRLIEAGLDREAALRGASERPAGGPSAESDRKGETMDTLTQFGHVGGLLAGVVGGITPDQLDRPTPCSEFTVRGVLEHMIGGATAFAAAYRGETPTEPDMSDVLAGFGPALQNLGAAVSAPGALEKTIAAPFGDLDGDTFARFIVLDGLVHGWDLATATGQSYEPPDELVAAVDAFARQAIEPLRDGQTFAEAVEASPDASPIERLAAYTGRRPVPSPPVQP
jgi:uncharacterized protein (TIGR03086 family)